MTARRRTGPDRGRGERAPRFTRPCSVGATDRVSDLGQEGTTAVGCRGGSAGRGGRRSRTYGRVAVSASGRPSPCSPKAEGGYRTVRTRFGRDFFKFFYRANETFSYRPVSYLQPVCAQIPATVEIAQQLKTNAYN